MPPRRKLAKLMKMQKHYAKRLESRKFLLIDSDFTLAYQRFVARKNDRVVVILECSESRKAGTTPSRYYTKKNKKNTTEKLELRKYNPYMKKVTVHREVK